MVFAILDTPLPIFSFLNFSSQPSYPLPTLRLRATAGLLDALGAASSSPQPVSAGFHFHRRRFPPFGAAAAACVCAGLGPLAAGSISAPSRSTSASRPLFSYERYFFRPPLPCDLERTEALLRRSACLSVPRSRPRALFRLLFIRPQVSPRRARAWNFAAADASLLPDRTAHAFISQILPGE